MSLVRAATLVLLPTLTLGAVILTGTAEPLRAAANRTPKVRLAGVMVNHAIDREGEEMPELAFQGTFARTKVALIVDNPAGGIIGVDRGASSVDAFTDDTGTSLVDPDNPFGPFGFGERIVKDGARVALELESQIAPSHEARSITASGTIHLRTAHEKRTETSKTGLFKKGEVFQCGNRTFEVVDEGPSGWSSGYEIEVQTNEDIEAIVRWWIVEPDGQEIALEPMSTMTFGKTSRVPLVASQWLATGRIGVEAWHDATTVEVPFEVTTSVGMR
ncbi:MAG: hypothetical protein AAF726_20560 [Planctomycetota bacterium]